MDFIVQLGPSPNSKVKVQTDLYQSGTLKLVYTPPPPTTQPGGRAGERPAHHEGDGAEQTQQCRWQQGMHSPGVDGRSLRTDGAAWIATRTAAPPPKLHMTPVAFFFLLLRSNYV